MAASNDKFDNSMGPQTRCSNCQTVFEVPQELLESNDTRVRCGECLCIFDALAGLRRESRPAIALDPVVVAEEVGNGTPEGRAPAQNFSELDVTYSDFDLFSDDADLPEVSYFEETRNPVDLNFDSVEQENDETFSDTIFNHDVTINADLPLTAIEISADTPPSMVRDTDQVARDVVNGEQPPSAAEHDEGEPSPLNSSDAAPDADVDIEQPDDDDIAEFGSRARVDFSRPVQIPVEPIEFDYRDDADGIDAALAGSGRYVIAPRAVRPLKMSGRAGNAPVKKSSRWIGRSVMILFLVALVGGLYAYRERDKLYNNAAARPVMTAICGVIGCSVPVQFDAGKLRVLRRSIYSHPRIPQALVVNVVFKNDAEFEQRFPVLVISLLDVTGTQVATRDFYPAEYLADGMQRDNPVMTSKMSFDISLEINDPGSNADSFLLNFR